MGTDDQAFEILVASAKQAFQETSREDSNYEFSERDFLELIQKLWQDRYKSDQISFKAKCAELLVREGIDADK